MKCWSEWVVHNQRLGAGGGVVFIFHVQLIETDVIEVVKTFIEIHIKIVISSKKKRRKSYVCQDEKNLRDA